MWILTKPLRLALKRLFKDIRYSFCYSLTRKSIDKKPTVRLHKEGLPSNYSRPICFFSSYDKESIIRKDVYYYLNELVRSGFDIVFISTSDAITDGDLKKLSECCVTIINRVNSGYDFYSWKTGLERCQDFNMHTALLLANDSVLGPTFSIKNIIKRLENHDADIVGMTDSFMIRPHLQSYFVYCKKNVILSKEFRHFFHGVTILDNKEAIIRECEIKFYQLMSRKFHIAALYPIETIMVKIRHHAAEGKYHEAESRNYLRHIQAIDPVRHLWRHYIAEYKFPFIKKSLITLGNTDNEEILEILSKNGSTYSVSTLTS